MERTLRAGRMATFVYFGLSGFILGMWVVHIPSIEHRTGIDHAELGRLLLLLGAGSFAGMQAIGPLTDRFGARRVVPIGAALSGVAVVGPGLATNAWTLGAALAVLGACNGGGLNVGMNAHAVQVERGYGRPVMSAFHATYSIGGVLASLVGAATLGAGVRPAVTLTAVAVVCVAVAVAAAPALLRPEPARATAGAAARRRTPWRIWALAALALVIMLCEGVANDWSALHLRRVLHAPAATAALAYGAFATTMTIGRLLADRAAARLGAVAVLRYGASAAALGMAAAALSPWIPLALAGWAVFGAGLSGCVPQLFSAAGHADRDAAGVNVSRVAGIGYLGMLAGPAAIGALTGVMPLNLTFFLPVACCVAAAAAAGVLRPRAGTAGSVPEPAVDAAGGRAEGRCG
ncbi:MFS transporter [Actinomadura sp. RB99]|uniref:MFS transporter n=1 Tax=Actinomadura sp. RB99 TaxID=2691577 RepID=UPI001685F676|nr:MFS transporter [Actinomadura sp. RB99]